MRITVPNPVLKTLVVRDLDIHMGDGVQPLTLTPEDTLTFQPSGDIVVQFTGRPETVVFRAAHIRWYSIREREVKVPDLETDSVG